MKSLNIFISYSWKDINEVDKIDKDFQSKGITLIRDERSVHYHQSFKEFMKKVRHADYVLMVISDSYLKSRNCMYEVLEFIKDENYKDRILPLLLDNSKNVFTITGKAKYITYWEKEYKKMEETISILNPMNAGNLYEDLKVIESINRNINSFISLISDMKCITVEELGRMNYEPILNFIGL